MLPVGVMQERWGSNRVMYPREERKGEEVRKRTYKEEE